MLENADPPKVEVLMATENLQADVQLCAAVGLYVCIDGIHGIKFVSPVFKRVYEVVSWFWSAGCLDGLHPDRARAVRAILGQQQTGHDLLGDISCWNKIGEKEHVRTWHTNRIGIISTINTHEFRERSFALSRRTGPQTDKPYYPWEAHEPGFPGCGTLQYENCRSPP